MARRGENIRKRKDGRWEGRYIKARTSEGKIQWGYVYGTVYAEVKRVLIQKKAEAGFYKLKRTDLTFEALAEVWLHSLRNSIKESTYAHYSYTLHKYLLPVLSKAPVASLEESFLEQAMQQIIVPTDAAHTPLGNSSARECLSMLRRICKYAAHLRLIRPMELEVALPKAIDKISAPLSPVEQQRLYHYVQENPTPRKIGLLLGLELGLRIGEICGLQWGDFDLKLGTLKINRTVCRISCGDGHTKVVIQTPKTRTSRREIPIPKQILLMLKKLHGNASKQAAAATNTITEKAKAAVQEIVVQNKTLWVSIGVGILLVMVMLGAFSSCGAAIQGTGSTFVGTTYPSKDADMKGAEEDYLELEKELDKQIRQMESTHPGYDEYRYQLDEIGHDPYQLISHLTAVYEQFTRGQVKPVIKELFKQQYLLKVWETAGSAGQHSGGQCDVPDRRKQRFGRSRNGGSN